MEEKKEEEEMREGQVGVKWMFVVYRIKPHPLPFPFRLWLRGLDLVLFCVCEDST